MHDLNDALDELRSVIPYAHSPSVRKLSKIATLLLAKNYILMQANALEELRRLITYIQVCALIIKKLLFYNTLDTGWDSKKETSKHINSRFKILRVIDNKFIVIIIELK